ncbi:hypothetical protein GCWU000341_02218 [Oribacterium sp. oral taxon 078 str. F0262]|nr:hypothetical protein GCWU000341_02218 [Oribacterium sp. oral taxon 078 str. F0262]
MATVSVPFGDIGSSNIFIVIWRLSIFQVSVPFGDIGSSNDDAGNRYFLPNKSFRPLRGYRFFKLIIYL